MGLGGKMTEVDVGDTVRQVTQISEKFFQNYERESRTLYTRRREAGSNVPL